MAGESVYVCVCFSKRISRLKDDQNQNQKTPLTCSRWTAGQMKSVCLPKTDGGAWSRVSVCETFFSQFCLSYRCKIKKKISTPPFLPVCPQLFLCLSLLFACVIKSAAVNLCTDISSCWHSCENPQKHCEGFFNWILLAAHYFTANIYHMKFLDWQIFPQVYYIGSFNVTFADIFRLFSTMDAYQRWSFIFFICTFNFLQVDMREEMFVWMKQNVNVRMFCIDFNAVILLW